MMREVAVLDAIHRGGSYSTRVRRLGPFLRARRRVSAAEAAEWGPDVADPLYCTSGSGAPAAEGALLAATVRHLQLACGGLLNFLSELEARCAASTDPMPPPRPPPPTPPPGPHHHRFAKLSPHPPRPDPQGDSWYMSLFHRCWERGWLSSGRGRFAVLHPALADGACRLWWCCAHTDTSP